MCTDYVHHSTIGTVHSLMFEMLAEVMVLISILGAEIDRLHQNS